MPPFKVYLMKDPIAGWYHVNVLESVLCPVDEMKTVFISSLFHCPVFFKCVRIKARVFNCQ